MDTTDLKTSEFIEKYTKIHEATGKSYIDAVSALIELYARIKTIQDGIKDIHSALGDYGLAGIEFDKRLSELEGNKKIEIVSPDQASAILKG